ncbi:MAG: hypothetical protein R6U50_14970 [Desulfobacterales bacterium]
MSSTKDMSDSLVEEILTEVATKFLDERKRVEEQLRAFESYLSQLKSIGRCVVKRAASLNYFLLNREGAADFYRCIGIEDHPFIDVKGRLEKGIGPPPMPFAILKKHKYTRLVKAIYTTLKSDVDAYLYGKPDDDQRRFTEEEQIPVNLRMVLTMADLVNENIMKLTDGKSPSSVLQYARSLNPEILEKEKITGAVSSEYTSRLDQKLAYQTIDKDRLPIDRFPEMPGLDRIGKDIDGFCERLFASHKPEIWLRYLRFRKFVELETFPPRPGSGHPVR